MNTQNRFSLLGQGFLAGVAAMLILGADDLRTEPFGQAEAKSAEQIHLYETPSIQMTQSSTEGSIVHLQNHGADSQRWVF
ncbi:hypothetical protein [Azomonas macrocytogenes]|uniref:Uncharacterized protein n=1 Tax=Azomonas macrocytogenes TaxID=69962 RepID=A0A839T6A7_AZOMA|nr:hypothetical protein [Azomonas macrocytogenes]MBB3103824.1 hypothetical protein [Azomonas macrocytogenes]